MAATFMSFGATFDFLAPMWVEISFATFFSLGFLLMRLESRSSKHRNSKAPCKNQEIDQQFQLQKTIEANFASGDGPAALKAWRLIKHRVPAPVDALKHITQLLVDEDPVTVTKEISEHVGTHIKVLGNSRTSTAVLEVIARAGNVELMQMLANSLQSDLGISPSGATYEVLLGGYANVGDSDKVAEVITDMQSGRHKLTARGYSVTIKGYLKNGMVDLALEQIRKMRISGFSAPLFALAQLFRTASQQGRITELFQSLYATDAHPQLPMPSEVVAVVMEDCFRHDDIEMAFRVEEMSRNAQTAIPVGAYDSLLKLCVVHSNVKALTLFERMNSEGVRISEGLCVGLLARCAESKFLRFAEEIARFVRGRDGMSIAVYSALMKVYAYCGMYDKACDLYAQIRSDGLEPDATMYGCLMKFSVECGRTELSQELFEKAPTLDIQNYMSLIRAAGRDRDVNRAFAVLDKLRASGVHADIAAYNCVLDACVSAGDMERAHVLLEQIKQMNSLDIITYNTLLKGYCATGDLRGAKDVFREMEGAGFQPNDVSYNCLINAAVSKGAFKEAWSTIELMERSGVAVDNYTISIMMKALKNVKDLRDVRKALSLLDRAGLDICSDEVLLNTVLETCTRHRQVDRIATIISAFSKSQLRPSVHTYGSMIKGCSALKDLNKCWEFWQDMTDLRALEPNDIVLGCMLDALVCNGSVDEAVKLFRQWMTKVRPNTVMFSTLIKGFANGRRPAPALELWKEMHELGLPMNTVVYNTLIDSQARVGEVESVSKLIAGMERDGCRPDAITYSTIVKAYCIRGELDKALEVFRDMQGNSMAKDCIVYNTMLDGCTRHNRMDLADMILDDMDKYNIQASNFTLGILVKMYGRRHQLDKAFEVVRTMPEKHGITVNAQVNTSLMCSCMNGGNLDLAFKVFNDWKLAGHTVDAKAYSVLISGCVRHGHVPKAIPLVEEACDRVSNGDAHLLENEPLEQLFRALSQQGQAQTVAVPLMEKLRAAGVPINGRLVSSLHSKNDVGRQRPVERAQNRPPRQQVYG